MAYASAGPATHPYRAEVASQGADLRFKADHPRSIDRYIDYFGGAAAALGDPDACGGLRLDRAS